MASINEYGGADPDTLADPPLGGPDGWAAAVAAVLDEKDETVDARVATAAAAHAAAGDPHPQYLTPAEHGATDHSSTPGAVGPKGDPGTPGPPGPPGADGAEGPIELPPYTAADAGKSLVVKADGTLTWRFISGGGGAGSGTYDDTITYDSSTTYDGG
jgi:hypothetical protein